MGKRQTVVVVDDDEIFLDLVSLILQKKDLRVLKAASAHECLEFLKVENVEMIVTDISMPDIDGLQLARMIRLSEGYGAVPIILLTSGTSSGSFHETRFKANAFCLKERIHDQLLPEVSQLLKMDA